MRILVIAPQPFYQERGTPIATRLLIEALLAAGHEVDVLTYHVGEDPQLPGVRVFRAPAVPFVRDVPIGFSVRKLLCDLALAWRLLTLTRRYRYDVLHAVEEAVFLSLLVRGARRSRIVYDMDSSLPEQLLGKYRALQRFDGVLRRLERLRNRALGSRAHRVRGPRGSRARLLTTTTPSMSSRTSRCSTTTACRHVENLRRDLPEHGVLALYVGNLEDYQGVDLLLDAVAALDVPVPLKFVAIGGNAAGVAAYRARAAGSASARRNVCRRTAAA